MNFFIVYVKNRKKFDKYVKVNKIRNKTIIDIKQQLDEYGIEDYEKYKDYFNLIIFTKIVHTLNKKRDIYYIPKFNGEKINIDDILQIKNHIEKPVKFVLLVFFEDFENKDSIPLNDINMFDASQIISDY